jgi:hypothetical protein
MEEKLHHNAVEGSEKKLLRWMMVLAGVVTAALLVSARIRMAAGFGLGAAVAIAGFWWLARAVRSALDAASGGRAKRKGIGFFFFLRYPLALGAVLLIYKTHWLPLLAVLAGMFVPLAGAIFESLVQLSTWAKEP